MDALKIRERYVCEATAQVDIMKKAVRVLWRIQDKMKNLIDCAAAPQGEHEQNHQPPVVARLGESFEPEGGLLAQVEAAARDGLGRREG